MAKLTKEKKKELTEKFNKMGWQILEAKFCYYQGPTYDIEPLYTDAEYDVMETKYRKLGKKLKLEPKAADLVGFPPYATTGAKGMISQHMIASKGRGSRIKGSQKKVIEEIKKEVSATLKTLKKVLKKELSEKKAKIIYKKVKDKLDPNK